MNSGVSEVVSGRICVFCGSAADSREHVFAKRLCKRAGAIQFLVVPGLYQHGKGTKKRQEHNLEAFQVRQVCAGCNSSWMNELESWFEQSLGTLIEPTWPQSAISAIKAVRVDHSRMALWLFKTAVMFSLASIKGALPVEFPKDATHGIRDGVLPNGCWVDLAYARETTVGGTISRCFSVINGGKYEPSQVLAQGLGFRFTVQFNHLLLRIARTPGAKVTYRSW